MFSLLFLLAIWTTFVISEFDPTSHKNWNSFDHDNCGHSRADVRIIGGNNAAMGAYPWIARIGYVSEMVGSEVMFRCGAVILNKKTILTAAHCVHGLPNNLKVGVIRVGEHNTETDPDCEDGVCADPVQDFKPSEIIIHRDYNKPLFKNDISLIRLHGEIKFTTYVKPICMMHGPLMTKDFIGSISEVAGWGIYDLDNPKPSVILQTVKLPIVENELCKLAFSKYASIGPTQMCVGGMIGQDSCGGDSGGPLMKIEKVTGPDPKYYLLGIVSFGAKNCGETKMPGVYTRMSSYMNWTLDNVNQSTSDYEVETF